MPRNSQSKSFRSRVDAATRNLLEFLGPAGELELPAVRPEHADLSLGDSVSVSHPLPGWGTEARHRRHMKVIGVKLRPGNMAPGLRLLDWQGARLNIGCHFGFNFENSGPALQGMMATAPHSGWCLTRGTRGWFQDPRGGVWQLVNGGYPRAQYISAGRSGMLMERRSRNLALRTYTGTTGLLAHTGSGTTTEDTSSVFDQSNPGLVDAFKRLILTAGSPHTTTGVQWYPLGATAVGGSYLTLSILHQHPVEASTLYWGLWSQADNYYWNEATQAWGAAVVYNAMAEAALVPTMAIATRTAPSTATKYQVAVVQYAGGTAARKNYIHHVQLEEHPYESSPMPIGSAYSEGAPGQRDDELFQVDNPTGKRVALAARGTILMRFIPNWDSTDQITSRKLYAFALEYSSHSIALYFLGGTGWVLEVVNGSGTHQAIAAVSVTRGAEIKLGVRWADDTYDELLDELGAAGSGLCNFDLWVDNVQVATMTPTAPPTESDESRLQVFCRDGDCIDGIPLDFTSLKAVLTAEEMASAT